jgi:hypothetical protein
MKSRKKDRQVRALELLQERAKRTPRGQVDHLDKLLGKGQGAVKERAKLELLITKQDSNANAKTAKTVGAKS